MPSPATIRLHSVESYMLDFKDSIERASNNDPKAQEIAEFLIALQKTYKEILHGNLKSLHRYLPLIITETK